MDSKYKLSNLPCWHNVCAQAEEGKQRYPSHLTLHRIPMFFACWQDKGAYLIFLNVHYLQTLLLAKKYILAYMVGSFKKRWPLLTQTTHCSRRAGLFLCLSPWIFLSNEHVCAAQHGKRGCLNDENLLGSHLFASGGETWLTFGCDLIPFIWLLVFLIEMDKQRFSHPIFYIVAGFPCYGGWELT